MLYKWLNGLWLYQAQPYFIYLRKDLTTWLFMQTRLQQWLLNNKQGWFLFDILFYSMPLIYFLIYKFKKRFASTVGIIMLIVNFCYIQCYALYPINSIEAQIAWMLFPILFITKKEKTFALLFDGLRYFFLFFFASAAAWKIGQGGIFNIDQMSAVLLFQHNQLLTNSPGYWQTNILYYLIQHPVLSYCIYLSAAILEASFIIGFFTKKVDRLLVWIFIVFLIADYFIMRIPYFEVSALLLTLMLKSSEINNTDNILLKTYKQRS
jgi:hypothetical protein